MQAFFNSLFSLNGGWTIGLGACKVFEKLFVTGVPFALGVLFQTRYGPNNKK